MIAIADLLTIFKRVIDESQSDYFTDTEIYGFLNDAQLAIFNKLVDPNAVATSVPGKNAYWESSQKISEYVQPFLKAISGSMSGGILSADISTALGRDFWGIRSIQVQFGTDTELIHADWKRQAEKVIQSRLSFYQPSTCNVWLTVEPGGYKIHPETSGKYQGYAIVYPLKVSSTQDSEFPQALTSVLAYKAAKLAGISMRDDEFVKTIEREIEAIGV